VKWKTHVPAHALQIRVIETLEELEALRPAWEELLASLPQASIFSSWEWLAPWWRAFGDGQRLHVISFQSSAARLAGIAPLSFSTLRSAGFQWKIARLMGDGSKDSDNLDLPVLPEYEEEFVDALLLHLNEHSRQWDFCEWNTVPENSPLALHLPMHLKERGWTVVTTFTPCSSIPLPHTWDLYLKQLSARERGNVRSFTRRLERLYRVQYRRCSQFQDIKRDLESLFELHQLRWRAGGQPGTFNSPTRRQFYYDLASLLLSRNQLELWFLELNERPVAAQFGFRFRSVVYALQAGFDPAFTKDSVGYVLCAHALRTLIGEGIRKYDFLGGVSDSKTRWGAEIGRYVNFRFSRPRSLGGAYVHARREVEGAKEWLRPRAPRRIWQMLHNVKMKFRKRGAVKSSGELLGGKHD
jgi:CelD/BcsL family acetyltransferase involved in cellulose biosynthesis